jgi:hypothetical protein
VGLTQEGFLAACLAWVRLSALCQGVLRLDLSRDTIEVSILRLAPRALFSPSVN